MATRQYTAFARTWRLAALLVVAFVSPCVVLAGELPSSALAVDADQDGVLDQRDNCSQVHNPAQPDRDRDGIGDACDPDRDGDGILNVFDNCPAVANDSQSDSDADGIGDHCAARAVADATLR